MLNSGVLGEVTRFEAYQETPIDYDGRPVRNLIAAVLSRAIRDIIDQDRIVRRSAVQWFASNRKKFLSFLHCCHELSLDPELLRLEINKLKRGKVSTINVAALK